MPHNFYVKKEKEGYLIQLNSRHKQPEKSFFSTVLINKTVSNEKLT